ncbi:MAG: M28 family peptidase [Acidobacteriaceae bacterium]|nr:M28 family peptidase [Acidobacteriaceae bacterium]
MSHRSHEAIYRSLVIVLLLWLCVRAVAETLRYSRVPRETIDARLERYAGDNQQRESTLKQIFSEAGCDNQHLSEQKAKGLKQPNLICLLPGTSERVIIVGAHFDRVSMGDGVVDNWSGASLLPSLYEAVKVQPRKHTYVFIGFSGEEAGEVGSHYYVQRMAKENVAATDAMVNMDTLGLGPTKIWASHSDQRLTGVLVYIAKQLNLPVSIINVDNVGSSDSEQFAARKVPRITVHSLTQQTWDARIIHSNKDRMSAIQHDDYYQSYVLLAAYLTFLDQATDQTTSSAR